MSELPLVSILSPVFNEQLHIEEMISSVLSQGYATLELIIVDDGSTDETVAIALQAQERDSRVRVVSEGKLGKVRAFNRGYAEASGEIILLMGGDDRMPDDSVSLRASAIRSALVNETSNIAAFGRLRTFSDNPKFDGQVIPRNANRGARSGGTLALSRPLADIVFPIPETLPAEDIWLGGAAAELADLVVDIPEIVLNYRIHAGNSNPRNQDFSHMTESMHARMNAYRLLADQSDFELPEFARTRFRALARIEELRYAGDVGGVLLLRGAPISVRLRAASMASPVLFELRRRLFKLFSGW